MSWIMIRRAAHALVAMLFLLAAPLSAQTGTFPDVSIAGSTALCQSVALVGPFWTYTYRVTNGPGSNAPIASLALDISAPAGLRPAMLPTDGFFLGDGTRTAVDAKVSHVPVGMVVPHNWAGNISAAGYVEWYAEAEGVAAISPVAPGAQSDAYVLRSTYLPGVRQYRLLPDYPYLCCPYPAGDPRNDAIHVKSAFNFQVEGWTVGPVYAPEQMSPSVAAALVRRVCALGWITNAGLCHTLEVKLEQATQALAGGDADGARTVMAAMLEELEAQHGPQPGKHVTDPAYLLLKANVEYLIRR